jgi:fumarylacetoacetase
MTTLDETHDPARRSWVASANGHTDFPIQNLPLGVFSTEGGPTPRGGVAIGDCVLDLVAARRADVFTGEAEEAATLAAHPPLNAFLAAGAGPRRVLRAQLSALLAEGSSARAALEPCLVDRTVCTMHLPATIGDYTDFYAGIHHALNVGRQFRPDQPLLPNYKYVPIGYHGRSSSIVVSGTPVRRPHGQRKGPSEDAPTFGPSRRLDYELELGIWIGPGNALGAPIGIADADAHIAGLCLLNDWSARDLQAWEYQPLGPFLAKNFATSISPWIVTPEALAPFRAAQPPRPDGDPAPLPYLTDARDQAEGAFEIELEVLLHTPCLKAANHPPQRLSIGSTRHLYWTIAQLLTHHASNGCNLRPGDLLGTGTISAPTPDGFGSLLEISAGGKSPIALASGSTRTFLEDGDEVIIRARASRAGAASFGFGEVRGVVTAAR